MHLKLYRGSMGGPALVLARITFRTKSWLHGKRKGTPSKLKAAEYQLTGPCFRGRGHAFLVRARNRPIRFSFNCHSDFKVVYPCGISLLSTACTTRGYLNERRPWRYVQKDTMCTWTAMERGLVGYLHTPTAPKIGAKTGAMVPTKSSTSASVRSAICCGIGNPAVSHGI